MESLSLKKIASVINAECETDAEIKCICTDTRKIEKGCLFIAVEGEKFDGHDFVEAAFQKGACAAVCHKKVMCGGTVLMVQNTVDAYLQIAGYYRSLFNIPVIGLTGSVGKTTTKEFTALAMSAKYKTLKTEQNFNNEMGMPATLLRLDKSYEAAVVEMGMNHFGEIHRLVSQSRPTMGIITNIGLSHIENLGSRDGILKAKLEILDGMSETAPLILNGDDDKLISVRSDTRKIYYFGIQNKNADFLAYDIVNEEPQTRFKIKFAGGTVSVIIPITGIHNVMDALAGFAAAYLNGASAEKIAAVLGEYVPAGMRQKSVKMGDYTVIEDCYNASPDSMRAAISTLASTAAKKRIAVLGDMLELGSFSEELHRQIGAFAAENNIDVVLGYGSDAKFYCLEAEKDGVGITEFFEDKKELLEKILASVESGTVILFKGSHAMHLEETVHDLYERKGLK